MTSNDDSASKAIEARQVRCIRFDNARLESLHRNVRYDSMVDAILTLTNHYVLFLAESSTRDPTTGKYISFITIFPFCAAS